ncbi:endosomal/prevacuolar sodium/hydrogen exchanger [Kluyveromyces marxianus]|uniref:Sodium/hydrogen exchanger n=1 Tax=Kluyveromyces marxianus TaxID=4911 RepID=A0ABX6EWX8_KLUMA|nr:endosomal/prevacuolar sodium/hydrogen exchanger [Kluyveromyces marxianus]
MKKTALYIALWLIKARMGYASGEDDEGGDNDGEVPIPDDPDDVNPITEEMFSSWALFILLFLLIAALWSSYMLTRKRVRAVHETVLSIFYGMLVGLIIRLSPGHYIQDTVTFNSSYFFNVLLPPIILNSGYELNQVNFFNNIVSILTFAIPGTLISAIVLGTILFIWTSLGLEGINISFVDALSVGATLSATDPVTILSIFNAYKVDPKLYTIIFGESLLNDAISIVMFETCQKFHGKKLQFSSFFEGIGMFLMTFTVSLLIGCMIGMLVALLLKHTYIRRYPEIESCIILLVAYQSYFFSNGCHMSGIVSLLFCGITLKHYAYFNMSRRTQVTLKYIFQLLARLSENFIFIYLGLALFTEVELVYKPMLIIITAVSICVARWCAVLPLSNFVNWFYRIRTLRSMGLNSSSESEYSIPDEIPYQYQMMVFWAGLRGAVGVALAMGIQGEFKFTLLATVLVVVVLTVIIFGGTTASMLEILNIKTGCEDENDLSDDEFDIEAPRPISLPSGNLDSTADFRSDFPPLATSANGGLGASPNEQPATNSRFSFDRSQIRSSVDKIFNQDKWFANFDEQVLKPVFLDNPSDAPSRADNHSSDSPNFMSSRRT